MKGRDISVLGKGLKVGISPALQQMAMCGSDSKDGQPGRLQGLRSSWSSARVRSSALTRVSSGSTPFWTIDTTPKARTAPVSAPVKRMTIPHRFALRFSSSSVVMLLLLPATWGIAPPKNVPKKESPMIATELPQGFLDPLAETVHPGGTDSSEPTKHP